MTRRRPQKVLAMGRATLAGVAAGVMFILALAIASLAATAPVAAQPGPMCATFAEGAAGLDSWGPCTSAPNIVATTSNVGSIGGAGDYHLHIRDTSGPSAACSTDARYLGNWVEKMGGCGQFCFDFKLFKSGTPPASVRPSFSIYAGSLRAVFVANVVMTSADPWQQNICAPIKLIQNGENLPSSASGQWRVLDSSGVFTNAYNANWNAIITSVTSVQLPVDFTSDPSEEVGYDNMCMTPGGCGEEPKEPELTGCLKDSKVKIDCNPDGTYTLTLASGAFTGTDITLTALTAGVTVSPAAQPWAATTTWTIVGAVAGQAVTLAANTTKVGGGSVPGTDLCCSGEIKIVMPECPKPPPLPPIDLKIEKEGKVEGQAGANFTLVVTNAGGPITFPAGGLTVTDSIPLGFTATGVTSPNWTCTPQPPPPIVGPGTLTCTYNLAGSLAAGAPLPDAIVVSGTLNGQRQVENCATVTNDPAAGIDTDLDNNKDCATVSEHPLKPVDIKIEKTGATSPPVDVPWYSFTLMITNVGAPFSGNGFITVAEVVPAGMTFTGIGVTPVADWSCSPLPAAAGTTVTCIYIGAGPTAPFQPLGTIKFMAEAVGNGPFGSFNNCAEVGLAPGSGVVDINDQNDRDCVTVSKPQLKPLACDPATTKVIEGTCACLYSKMTRLSPRACGCTDGNHLVTGKGCLPDLACKAPLRLNKAGTACICEAGLEWNGKTCVKPASRPVPKVPKLPEAKPDPVFKLPEIELPKFPRQPDAAAPVK